MATKATNLICNVVVYQNSCFIGYHGYQWYQYVFFPIKPFCLRFYRNRVSVFRVRDVTSSQISNVNVNQMSNIKASNPRLLSYLFYSSSSTIFFFTKTGQCLLFPRGTCHICCQSSIFIKMYFHNTNWAKINYNCLGSFGTRTTATSAESNFVKQSENPANYSALNIP